MRQEFYQVYEALYEEFEHNATRYVRFPHLLYYGLSPDQVQKLVGETRRAIGKAIEETYEPLTLRPDAKYFLLLNFYEMVLFPMTVTRDTQTDDAPRESYTDEQMRNDLDHDMKLILQEAAKKRLESIDTLQVPQSKESEITGHNVIDAIKDVWDKMKYNEYLYWASK